MWLLFNGSFSMNRLFFMSHLSTTFKDLLKVTKFNPGTPQLNQVVNLSWKKQFLHPPPGTPSSLWVVRYLEMQISFYRFTLPFSARCRLLGVRLNLVQSVTEGSITATGTGSSGLPGVGFVESRVNRLQQMLAAGWLAGHIKSWKDVSRLVCWLVGMTWCRLWLRLLLSFFFFKTDDFFEKMGSTA